MRMCQKHWLRLREGVVNRGLDAFITKSGADAAASVQKEMEGGDRHSPYDPLLRAALLVTESAMYAGGDYLHGRQRDGSEYCPICEAVVHRPPEYSVDDAEQLWINSPLDAIAADFRERNWVPKLS